jgi:CubicO group peptidase (beta-lactamase class C family)
MPDASVTRQLASFTARRVPGISIAIAGHEGLWEATGVGNADLAARLPASADMICPWFSMTKIITASMAMRLTDQGLLDLDQPVLPLVPELAMMQPRPFAECITPRHPMAHSAGLASPIPVRWIHPAHQPGPSLRPDHQRLPAAHEVVSTQRQPMPM